MTTELEIIHTIWDTVRAGSKNQDDPINERLLRSYLRIHRGRKLHELYKDGTDLPDELFQDIGEINFFVGPKKEWISSILPKTIRLNNYGFMLDKDGYAIQVVNSEEFENSKNHPFNKYQPKVKFINERMFLYTGKKIYNLEQGISSVLNDTIDSINAQAILGQISINGKAILVNPDDERGYDFTSSAYPCPDEIIEHIMSSVNAREFQFFLNTRSDETGDGRDNSSEFNTREEV